MSHSFDNTTFPSKGAVYAAKWMGECVQPFIAQMGTARVLGVTSKGAFLQHSTGQVVFLSGEDFRGPLTINLVQRVAFKSSFAVGETCRITQDNLAFKSCHVLIGSETPVWEPPPIRFEQGGMLQALQRGIDLAELLLVDYQEGLFFAYLEQLVADQLLSNPVKLWTLMPEWQGGGDILEGLTGLIGLGRGLTPAGDDFICGFLLACHHSGENAALPQCNNSFSDHLAASAQEKTTSLSASLIHCAAKGEADERVLNALRWIAQGTLDIRQVSKDLRSYGSSSGLDALAGMLAAILHLGVERTS